MQDQAGALSFACETVPFLFLSFSFACPCFSFSFFSLTLLFLFFQPWASTLRPHLTKSILIEYYTVLKLLKSKWGIVIWKGPIANLSFLRFLKTNVQRIHMLVFPSFDGCSYICTWNQMKWTSVFIVKGSWEAMFRVTDDFIWWRAVWDFTSDEGWCETLHLMKGAVGLCIWCDFTSDEGWCETTFDEGWCEALQLMRLYIWSRVVWDFTSGGVVTKGVWWLWEMVMKGGGDLG